MIILKNTIFGQTLYLLRRSGEFQVKPTECKLTTLEVSYTENGMFTELPPEGYTGMSQVNVTVDVPSRYNEGVADGIAEQKSKLSTLEVESNGIYEREDGYKEIVVAIPSDIHNQDKEVTYTTNGTNIITPDSEYSGLGSVEVTVDVDLDTPYNEGYSEGVSDQKAKLTSLNVTTNGTYTREDGYDVVEVNTPEINNQNKTVESSTVAQVVTADAGYSGLGQVTVNPYELDSKQVEYTTNGVNTITSDKDGLSSVQVTVNVDTVTPYNTGKADGIAEQKAKLTDITITQNGNYTREDGYDDVTVNVDLQTPYDNGFNDGEAAQKAKLISESFVSNGTYTREDGFNEVIVAVPSDIHNQSKTADPSTDVQEIIADAGYSGLSKVTINAVTNEIDSNITAGNIKKDVVILGVEGTYDPQPELQSKTVSSSTSAQTVVPDSGFDGLSSVTVNPYTVESKSATITENGTTVINPTTTDALSGVSITVDVQPDLESKVVTYTANDTYVIEPTAGKDGLSQATVTVAVPSDINNQDKQVTYTQNGTNTITADQGYSGLGSVEVTVDVDLDAPYEEGYLDGESAQKAKLEAITLTENGTTTREDGWNSVTVNVQPDLESKIVEPTTVQQVVTPTTGYDGLSSVTVNAVTSSIDQNIQAGNIKSGVSILGIDGTFEGGTLQSKTVSSSTTQQTVTPDAGNYGLSQVVVEPYTVESKTTTITTNGTSTVSPTTADALSDVSITVNVQPSLQDKTVNPSTSQQVISADSGYDGLDEVTVNAVTSSIDSNIQANNIKRGVSILGVTGTVDEGITPTGNINITTTAQTDVTNYATAQVVDANLSAANIKDGVTILGIEGTYDPQPSLESKSVTYTQNDTYNVAPATGYDGLSGVEVTVNVAPDLEDITITENGVYTSTSHDGFGEVTVDVSGGGGASWIDVDTTALDLKTYVPVTLDIASAGDWTVTAPTGITVTPASGTKDTKSITIEATGIVTNGNIVITDGTTTATIPVTSEYDYFTLEITDATNSVVIKRTRTNQNIYFNYKIGNGSWKRQTGSIGMSESNLAVGTKILVYTTLSTSQAFGDSSGSFLNFSGSGYKVYGDLCYLYGGGNNFHGKTITASYAFAYMFGKSSTTTGPWDASGLRCSSPTLPDYGFYKMFMQNRNLLYAPEELNCSLNGTRCYDQMFASCTKLIRGPKIKHLNGTYACNNMFSGCNSLLSFPDIEVESVASNAVYQMFNSSGLNVAPRITITGSGQSDLSYMFYYSQLMIAAEIVTPNATVKADYMYDYCSGLKIVPPITANITSANSMFADGTNPYYIVWLSDEPSSWSNFIASSATSKFIYDPDKGSWPGISVTTEVYDPKK